MTDPETYSTAIDLAVDRRVRYVSTHTRYVELEPFRTGAEFADYWDLDDLEAVAFDLGQAFDWPASLVEADLRRRCGEFDLGAVNAAIANAMRVEDD